MTDPKVDNADPATAIDDDPASSAEHGTEDGSEVEELLEDGEQPLDGDEPKPEEDDPSVILTRNTQQRFDKLTTTIADQRAELDRLNNKAPVDVSSLTEPNPDDFDDGLDDRGYIAAKGAHDGSIATLNLINKTAQEDQQAQAVLNTQQKITSYVQKTEVVKKEITDFETIVKGTMLNAVDADGNYTEATIALLEVENGPQVAYHLAKNPTLAISLNRSTPTQVAMAISRLSVELSASPAKTNDNPAPIGSADKGGGRGAPDDNLPNIKGARFE